MLVTDRGQMIRIPVHDIRIAGRNTQGVTLFDVAEDEHVVSVARLVGAAEANGGAEPDEPEPGDRAGPDEPERNGPGPDEPERAVRTNPTRAGRLARWRLDPNDPRAATAPAPRPTTRP